VSSDKRYVLSAVRPGSGWALDLGGGDGELAPAVAARGYRYVNVDLRPAGPRAVGGDAARLPFADRTFDVVVSSDSLEHFASADDALREARRVLSDEGTLVVWVPFMHPFHGDDLYRYTPLGLRHVLERTGFHVVSIDAPLSIASYLAQVVVTALQRVGLGRVERPIERGAAWVDRRFFARGGRRLGFAAAYLVTARTNGAQPP
jgi:SAM-dependent methyltransferase